MERAFIGLAGLQGFLSVALGAFGAHGLRRVLAGLDDGALRLSWWETAAHYGRVHALAIALAAWLVSRGHGGPARLAGVAFAAGSTVFSATLYAMALGAPRWLGAVTPLGGVLLLAGWAAVGACSLRTPTIR